VSRKRLSVRNSGYLARGKCALVVWAQQQLGDDTK